MAIRLSLAGWALSASLGLAGCVTEPGKQGPALWTSVDDASAESDVRLKNPVRLHTAYGRVAEANGRRNVARKHYETALSHDGKCVEAIVGVARLDQADGQTRQAELGFQKALKLAPKNADVLQAAGLFYSTQGRWREAVASLNAAVAAAPSDTRHRYALAIVLAKSGDLNGAMPQLIASVGRAEAHSQMARILLERGDRTGAEQQLQAALAQQPNLDSARRLIAQVQADDRRQSLAAAGRDPAGRGTVRSVRHEGTPRGLGTQSAWQQEPPQRSLRGRYANQRISPDDGRDDDRRDGHTLQIVPGTNRPQQPGESHPPVNHSEQGRFRSPMRVHRGDDGSQDDSVPQWNHQGRN